MIEHHRAQTNIPGVQAAVIVDGDLVWSQAWGYANIQENQMLQTTTPMRVASVSKSMTSVALGKLVEEGLLDLDKDIQSYVPQFPDKGYKITSRHLASSTSGIRHYSAGDPEYNQVHYSSVIDALSAFKDDPLLFEPGTDHHYSSYGWVLLSAVMEHASGIPFQKLMQRTWAELGMDHTYLDHEEYHPETISNQYILKRESLLKRLFSKNDPLREVAPSDDRSYIYAGGGYLSTAEDLVNMGWNLLNDDYLEATTRDILFRDQVLNNGENIFYGLGWETGLSRTGTPVVFHSGNMSSARSHLVIYPEKNVVFAIIMNTGDHVFFNDREAQTIAELFLPRKSLSQNDVDLAGEWSVETTSLRNKKSRGKITLHADDKGIISGNLTFTRSQKKKTFPIILVGRQGSGYHFVSVSPMFIDLYLTFDGDLFTGEWLHDFNVKGIAESNSYWKPRVIKGQKVTF